MQVIAGIAAGRTVVRVHQLLQVMWATPIAWLFPMNNTVFPHRTALIQEKLFEDTGDEVQQKGF